MDCVERSGQESESIDIIDRPELKSNLRVCAETLVTAGFWAAYLYCVLPVIEAALMCVGVGFADHLVFGGSSRGLISWLQFTLDLGLAVAVSFALWTLYNYVRYHDRSKKVRFPVVPSYPRVPRSYAYRFDGERKQGSYSFSRLGVPAFTLTLFFSCGLVWTPPCGEMASNAVRIPVRRLVASAKPVTGPAQKQPSPAVRGYIVPPNVRSLPDARSHGKMAGVKGKQALLLRVVEKGDTLSGLLVKRYGFYDHTLLHTVLKKNPVVKNADRILVGDKIILPPGKGWSAAVTVRESRRLLAAKPDRKKYDAWERTKISRYYPSVIF
jgi:poly-beta-1,6-N-acetyl-D-glucosamine biosynthesis protein PgaD